MRMATCHPDRKHIARGLCSACYYRWQRQQNPESARERDSRNWYKNRDKRLEEYKIRYSDPINREQMREKARVYRVANREKIRARKRKNYHKPDTKARMFAKKYGVSMEEIKRVLAISACQICGSDHDLHIDHDHNTGLIRGRLCGSCNKAIGLFRDSLELISKAAKYLSVDGLVMNDNPILAHQVTIGDNQWVETV